MNAQTNKQETNKQTRRNNITAGKFKLIWVIKEHHTHYDPQLTVFVSQLASDSLVILRRTH